jgi:hypothetical protein
MRRVRRVDNILRSVWNLNRAAFGASPNNQFGSAPRTLPGGYSPWRINVAVSVSKRTKMSAGTALSLRLEELNLFNIVQWAAPASSRPSTVGGTIPGGAPGHAVAPFFLSNSAAETR